MSFQEYRKMLGQYLLPHRGKVLLLFLVILMGSGLQLVNPQILRFFIDTATSGSGQVNSLINAALLFIGVAILTQGLTVLVTYLGDTLAWTVSNTMRGDLFAHSMRLDLKFHNNHTPGRMIERIDGDVNVLSNFFSQFGVRIVSNFLMLLGMLVFLTYTNWGIGLTFIAFTGVVMFMLGKIRFFATPFWTESRETSAKLFGFLEERLSGVEEVRANGAVAYVMRRLHELNRLRLHKDRRAFLAAGVTWSTTIGMFSLGTALSLALGAMLYANGTLSLGTVYLIYAYVNMLRAPIEQISQQLQDLQKASASIRRTSELLGTKSALVERSGRSIADGALQVDLDNVSFGYSEEERVLHNVTLTLAPGKVLGVLGRTGSGKSTMARLLMRFYDVNEGGVRLNGVDVRDASLSEVRKRVVMVTQDVQLFSGTIRDNLTFFDPAITDERILQAFTELELLEWYQALPEGLDTRLGPSGGGFSAGEGQLLAFARVFLADPALVILDEASSRLDPATEQLLTRTVSKLMENRTGIIIAHRLATLQQVDDILILEDGRIVQHGEREVLAHDPESRFYQLLRQGMEGVLV
ncbi:ABC transporter ATP-binding protein [Tumebacillus flagellatus]|uniref:Helicase n=1 Tax=Tumebacillus flagellatus TaxID=1157490 RepID=A0A074LKC0_9BACL|nr:ABC transporter ATP-binding protein [Tumebacillus flagellatus]KEO82581.1 helicase [Tumebacillus flagellatus]